MTGTGALLIFAGVVAVILLLINRAVERVRVARRVNLAMGSRGRSRVEARFVERSADIRGRLGNVLAGLGGLLPLGDEDRQKIGTALRRAGFRSTNTIAAVLGAKAACLLAGLATGIAVVPPFVTGPMGWGGGVVAGLLLGVLLNLLPEMVVSRLATLRFRRIRAGLADAFDLLIVCLEAGLTFERALQRTVADLKAFQPDLANELREVSLDMNVHGRTREQALVRMAERLDDQNFRDLATTVSQSERHGTPLADSLRKLGSSMRVETITAMQAKMSRLPVLLILPTLAFVLPGIMVIVGGPAFVQLMDSLSDFAS